MIRDVMESAGLAGFAEIGLVLFLLAFIFAVVRIWLIDGDEAEARSRMPLDGSDGEPVD